MRKVLYGDSVHSFAREWIDDQIEGGNDEMMADVDRYTDDLAQHIQSAVEEWISDRLEGRELFYAPKQKAQEMAK